jgi:hypothetical protein
MEREAAVVELVLQGVGVCHHLQGPVELVAWDRCPSPPIGEEVCPNPPIEAAVCPNRPIGAECPLRQVVPEVGKGRCSSHPKETRSTEELSVVPIEESTPLPRPQIDQSAEIAKEEIPAKEWGQVRELEEVTKQVIGPQRGKPTTEEAMAIRTVPLMPVLLTDPPTELAAIVQETTTIIIVRETSTGREEIIDQEVTTSTSEITITSISTPRETRLCGLTSCRL